jgi:hypothetical protein
MIHMSELENLIRQIVREEIQLYLQKNLEINIAKVNKEPLEQSEPQENEKEQDVVDYELFERRYEEAIKIDDQVKEKYKSQVDKYGSVISLKIASKILDLSIYAIRKLAKTDKNFPKIYSAKVGTARLFYWLDGGQAYWNIGEDND